MAIHPKSNLNKLKKIYKNFKVEKYKTFELIKNAKLVVFFDSSAFIPSLIFKKNIININTSLMGSWMEFRCKVYSKYVDFYFSYDLIFPFQH